MKSKMSDKVNRLSRQEPIRLQRRPPSLARLDMTKHVGRKEYETKLARLQVRLKELSLAYQSQKRRAVIVLEGWDAAGKGGVIRRMHWPLDPRGLKVWPISAPTHGGTGPPLPVPFLDARATVRATRHFRPFLVRPGAGGADRRLCHED